MHVTLRLLLLALALSSVSTCSALTQVAGGGVDLERHTVTLTTDVVEVPLDDSTRHLAVTITLGDDPRPLRFQLDTGCSIALTLDVELVARLGLPRIGTTLNGDNSGQRQNELGLHRVAELNLGGAIFRDVVALGDDYRWISGSGEERVWGLVGWPLFKELLLTIDFRDDIVRMERGSLAGLDSADVVADLGQVGPVIALRIGEQSMNTLIDTGTKDALMLPGADKHRFALRGALRRSGTARTVNNVLPVWAGVLEHDVVLGAKHFEAVRAIFVEGFAHPLIGHGLLGDARLTFDQRARLIRFDFGDA